MKLKTYIGKGLGQNHGTGTGALTLERDSIRNPSSFPLALPALARGSNRGITATMPPNHPYLALVVFLVVSFAAAGIGGAK